MSDNAAREAINSKYISDKIAFIKASMAEIEGHLKGDMSPDARKMGEDLLVKGNALLADFDRLEQLMGEVKIQSEDY